MTKQLKATNWTHLVLELSKLFALDASTAQRLAYAHCVRLHDATYHLKVGPARDFLAAL